MCSSSDLYVLKNSLIFERIFGWIFNSIQIKVNIQFRPVKVISF